MNRILLADPDPAFVARLASPLLRLGHRLFGALDADEASEVFRGERLDVVLLSLRLRSAGGLELLEQLRKWEPGVEVILLTDVVGAQTAVRAVKLGAFDVLPRFTADEAIANCVSRAVQARSLSREVADLRSQLAELKPGRLATPSPAMLTARELAAKAALSDVTVLITGESGVGKELIAREVIERGARSREPVVTIDAGSLPENLIESELFGYEKGAFTGAAQRKTGRIELADGGTVLLDEIGNLPLAMQPRLLRVLENREFLRVGGNRPVRVDVRFIAATNADLRAMVAAGRFREDLYHRLNVFPIHVAPLRERHDDIVPLAHHFREELARKHRKTVTAFSADALALLARYAWPGNVRELRNVIERAVILAGDQIERSQLGGLASPPADLAASAELVPLKQAKEDAANRAATVMIERALQQSGGDKKRAARLLGISLKTLYNHLERL